MYQESGQYQFSANAIERGHDGGGRGAATRAMAVVMVAIRTVITTTTHLAVQGRRVLSPRLSVKSTRRDMRPIAAGTNMITTKKMNNTSTKRLVLRPLALVTTPIGMLIAAHQIMSLENLRN